MRLDFNYAFTHNFLTRGFTFYGLAGFAYNSYNYSTSYGISGASQSGVSTISEPTQNRTYTSASLSLGLGLEYNFNYRTHLYLDLRYCSGENTNFSSNNLNNGDFLPNNFDPGYVVSALGMRFMLGPKPLENNSK